MRKLLSFSARRHWRQPEAAVDFVKGFGLSGINCDAVRPSLNAR
jgi:hypothetical protein